jgi:hypothetical protein
MQLYGEGAINARVNERRRTKEGERRGGIEVATEGKKTAKESEESK